LGRRPEITFSVGKDHVGLPEMLQEVPESRVQSVQRFLKFFGLHGADVEISAIAKLVWSDADKKWAAVKIFKDPELKKIEKSIWPENTL
jgi:hypothetical protein